MLPPTLGSRARSTVVVYSLQVQVLGSFGPTCALLLFYYTEDTTMHKLWGQDSRLASLSLYIYRSHYPFARQLQSTLNKC